VYYGVVTKDHPRLVLMDGDAQAVFEDKTKADKEAAACGCGAYAYPLGGSSVMALYTRLGQKFVTKGI